MCQLRIEPHTAFLFRWKLPLRQEEQEGRNFFFQLLQEIRVIVLQRIYLPYPVSCFPCVYDYRQVLVVWTQYELGEEGYFRAVFPFGFHLVIESGAQILQPLAVFPAVEQHLVHDNEQLSGPVGIELAPEILIGVECHVIPEYGFQEIKERTLARVPLFRYQQEYGKFLQRLQEQQLQIVQSQIVLFTENV